MSLYTKLAEVMAEVGRVEKRGRNDFHNYDYVTEADLIAEVRDKLAARGVMVLPSVVGEVDEREITTARGQTSTVSTIRVAFTFVDGESGDKHTCEFAGQGDDGGDKGLYKAYTGALKYFLMKTFLIPTGDDPEGDTGTDQRSAERTSSTRRAKGPNGRPGKPTDKQVELIHKLGKQKNVTVGQLKTMLAAVGAEGVEIAEGWPSLLSGGREGQASALIDMLMNGPIPEIEPGETPRSDVPEPDAGDFEHPQESLKGTPIDG